MTRCYSRFVVGLIACAASGVACAQIVLFENANFDGRSFRSANSVSNLAQEGFNDRASSAVVEGGRWQICGDAFFGGRCVTIGPGKYPSLRAAGLNDNISSVRELGWTPDGRGGWGRDGDRDGDRERDRESDREDYRDGDREGSRRWGDGGNWGSGARAVLYSGRNMSGRSYVVEPRGIPNLESVGFNDRAMSLRVESGYWLFCTDSNFEGDCHTYGPGDYPNLPNGQDHKLSSGRRISQDYPYRQSPNWRR